jgi:uncharacterized membrane protein
MEPKKIRDVLRTEQSEDLDRRRRILLLSALGIFDFSLISLLQSGVIRKLPDIPYPEVFDTNGINTSKTAYEMGVPDATISTVMHALKMALTTAGGSRRSGRKPVFDLLLGGISLGHSLGALQMTYDMLFKKKKICIYCLTGAGLILSSAAIIAPTAIKVAIKAFGLSGKRKFEI